MVSTDHGNAHSTVNGAGFLAIKTFKDFKAQCQALWKPTGQVDKLANVQKLANAPREDDALVTLYTSIMNNAEQVRKDIMELEKFPTHTDENTGRVMVDLEYIINYFASGALYGACTEPERKAFKKLPLDPMERFSATIERLQDKLSRNNTGSAETTLAVTTFNAPVRGNF